MSQKPAWPASGLSMNFDQKAVKFLANFYINGGRHWTHGPLKPTPLLLPQTLVLLDLRHQPKDEAWFQQRAGPGQQMVTWPVCTQVLRQQLLGQRPPILIDLDVPSPATYKVAVASSVPEPGPHAHLSTGCKRPIHESQGRRVWPAQGPQSGSPSMQRNAFLREPKKSLPSPAFSASHSPPFASWIHSCSPCIPGPAAYPAEHCDKMRFPSAPGVVIQGSRRRKRHDTGPFCAV